MKTAVYAILATGLILGYGCSKQNLSLVANTASDKFSVKINAIQNKETKTSLAGTLLSWSASDKIGVFSDGLQYNTCFFHKGLNQFEGSFIKRDVSFTDIDYVAYYPYQHNGYDNQTNIVSGTLPLQQVGPFDGNADFIVSNIIESSYDENTPPSLNFTFGNHLFSIIKVTVTNSNPSLSQEKLLGVSVQTEGNVFGGDFTFDVFDPIATLSFSADPLRTSNKVSVDFPDNQSPELGMDTSHILYAVVNSTDVTDLQLTFSTTAGISKSTVPLNKTLKRGYITNLAPIDIGVLTYSKPHHTAVLWGDSISKTEVTDKLAALLGPSWTVVNAGVGGDTPISIAGRMGGMPICLMDNVTIPGNSSESVNISGIYSTYDSYGLPTESPSISILKSERFYNTGNQSLINNCTICGVECVIERGSNMGQLSIHRAINGEDVPVVPKTVIYTFGNTQYRNADVHLCYMGANGGFESDYNVLANFYQSMIDYSISKQFIVIGFHFTINSRWSEQYVEIFENRFGDQFLDLRTVGANQGRKLLVDTGVYALESQISNLDLSLMDSGAWPASWSTDYLTDVHPNSYGSKAIAIMAYEKMRSLGYLDD